MKRESKAIVDMHAHVHDPHVVAARADFAARDGWFAIQNPPGSRHLSSPARLIRALDANGASEAWALSFGWRDQGMCVARNDALCNVRRSMATADARRLRWFGAINPSAGQAAVREIERLRTMGFEGVGELFPDGQSFDVTDRAAMAPILESCEAAGLAVVVHASDPVGRAYPGRDGTGPERVLALIDIAAEVAPTVQLVVAHLGGGLPFYAAMPDVRRRIERTAVTFDTAACAYLYDPVVLQSVTRHLPGRIRFGSDHPVAGIRRGLAWVRDAKLDDEVLAHVLGNRRDNRTDSASNVGLAGTDRKRRD